MGVRGRTVVHLSPWSSRVEALLQAMPWTQGELAKKLGYRSWAPVQRILRGGRPAVGFLVRLAALEGAYEGEIKAWRDGLRVVSRGGSQGARVTDWRDGVPGEALAPGTKEEIRILGASEAAHEAAHAQGNPRIAVAPPHIWWRKRPRNKASIVGRPSASGEGLRDSAGLED